MISPAEFKTLRGGWVDVVSGWFYEGIDRSKLTPKPDIDVNEAWRHLGAIMSSYEPSHEHKLAATAYLMSLWFEPASGSTRRALEAS